MITDSFDTSKPIITPDSFIKQKEKTCNTCIITFSGIIFNHVLSTYKSEKQGSLNRIDTDSYVYSFDNEGIKTAIFLSRVGAPSAAMDLLAAHQQTGATKFIIFGSAGNLNPDVTKGKYVIPSQAYRDEGISYHYAKAEDYIDIKTSTETTSIFKEMNIPHITGRIWTTDAIYMETENLLKKRLEEGCLAVDMEIAGLQAVCNHYEYELYCFLETGDVLSTVNYDKSGLSKANHQLDKLFIALELAKRINN